MTFSLQPLRRHISGMLNGTTATQVDFSNEMLPVTRIETISKGVINWNKLGYVENYSGIKKYKLIKGDILLSHINSMPMIGNCALFEEDDDLYLGMNLLRLKPNKNTCPNFLFYCLNSAYVNADLKSYAKPAINQASISTANLKRVKIPSPNYKSQKEIADFLDRETDRIDQLIEKKKTFLLKASKRIESLVDQAISCQQVPRIRFENVVQQMQRSVNLSEHDELIRLGLYNRGRGIFKKPAVDEEGMGDSKFFFVEAGDLILSGQFAWEGAVALATSKEEGCVVSHRYPIYRGKRGINIAYLFGLLRSDFGDFILNEASRGSAGRNKPLNTWRLGKEKIPIPEVSLQKEVEQAVNFERRLREKTQESINILEEFRSSLITEAVTGQLDVKAWKKKGGSDKQLDKIAEQMDR